LEAIMSNTTTPVPTPATVWAQAQKRAAAARLVADEAARRAARREAAARRVSGPSNGRRGH
jgi:hypothetical protein